MRKGQPRPRKWSTRPTPGFPAEQTIRTAMLGIARGLNGKRVPLKDRIEFLKHYQRLENQLKIVTTAKLKSQLAILESSSPSEQVGTEKTGQEK